MGFIDTNIILLSKYTEKDAFTVGTVVKWAGDDFTIGNKVDPESERYDWVYISPETALCHLLGDQHFSFGENEKYPVDKEPTSKVANFL